MDWIEQNLDAYRVIAEILTDLRPLVRERLEAKLGKEWFREGIPESIFENLIQNKEKEASIDWYENRYQEVISYAVFPDLFEIIIANSGLFDPLTGLPADLGCLLDHEDRGHLEVPLLAELRELAWSLAVESVR